MRNRINQSLINVCDYDDFPPKMKNLRKESIVLWEGHGLSLYTYFLLASIDIFTELRPIGTQRQPLYLSNYNSLLLFSNLKTVNSNPDVFSSVFLQIKIWVSKIFVGTPLWEIKRKVPPQKIFLHKIKSTSVCLRPPW